jgi:hypothetical protein
MTKTILKIQYLPHLRSKTFQIAFIKSYSSRGFKDRWHSQGFNFVFCPCCLLINLPSIISPYSACMGHHHSTYLHRHMIHGCTIQFQYRCSSSLVKCEADGVSHLRNKGPWYEHLGNKKSPRLWFQLLIVSINLWQIGLCHQCLPLPRTKEGIGFHSKEMVRGWRIPISFPLPLSPPYQVLRKCFSKNFFGKEGWWRNP